MATESLSPSPPHKSLLRRGLTIVAWLVAVALVLVAALSIWFQVSPYPSAMLMRNSFEEGGRATNAIIEQYAEPSVEMISDLRFDESDPDAFLDVYYPSADAGHHGTIVWLHGGGWLAGNTDDLSPWARVLTTYGFSVVAVNYSLSPENHYPLAVMQSNAAFGYLIDNADELGLDPDTLILAGDSAGAQLAAQVALINTNPSYAAEFGVDRVIGSHKIAGMLLNCGPYDFDLVDPESETDGAKLVRIFLWSYTGERNFNDDSRARYASIPNFVTEDFPPSFVTAGNVDPLLPHSTSLVAALKQQDVDVDELFFPEEYEPALNHEYQFNLDTAEGQLALERMVVFSKRVTG